MIDKILANHIADSFDDISLFLKLVAKSIISGEEVLEVPVKERAMVSVYQVSGLLEIVENDPIKVKLREKDRWFAALPEIKTQGKKTKKEYVPALLSELATQLGYPTDWEVSKGKYLKNYNRLLKKYSKDEIFRVKDFVVKNNPEIDLNLFLTEKSFVTLRAKSYYKPIVDERYQDRVEAADYSRDQAF